MKRITRCKTCGSENLDVYVKGVSSFGFDLDLVDCADCGLRFRNIELDEEEIGRLYGDQYFLEEQKDFFFAQDAVKNQIFADRIRLVNETCPAKGKILDVGAAVGTFIEVAKNDGWEETGLEISTLAADHAKQRGLNCVNADFGGITQLGDTYDAITLWDVIDHSERPLSLMEDVRKVIKPEGFVFVSTIVIDSTMYTIAEWAHKLSFGLLRGPLLKGYPVHHTNYYSEKTMSNDLERAGFKVVRVVREGFTEEMFSGGAAGKVLFGLIEKLSKITHREIVCTLIARPA